MLQTSLFNAKLGSREACSANCALLAGSWSKLFWANATNWSTLLTSTQPEQVYRNLSSLCQTAGVHFQPHAMARTVQAVPRAD